MLSYSLVFRVIAVEASLLGFGVVAGLKTFYSNVAVPT